MRRSRYHATHHRMRVVCGVVVENGRVLVALRGRAMRNPGHWEFAGGKVEAGETPAQALVRELREELAITVEVGERITSASNDRLELISYWCTITEGRPRALEHAQLRWVEPDELDALPFAPIEASAVAAVRAALSQG